MDIISDSDEVIYDFSDLHFGSFSIESQVNFASEFKNVFNSLIEHIDHLIQHKKPCLVILSGDIGSIGNFSNSKYLLDFFNLWNENNIPLVFCNGNHDLSRSKIKKGK